MLLKILLLLTASSLLFSNLHADQELATLSMEELLAIPIDKPYRGIGIFQSETNKISEDSVNFGLIIPLSSLPRYSTSLIAAADMAADVVNAGGGIQGRRLVIIRADNDHSPDASAEFAATLIKQYDVQAFIGPGTSDSAFKVLNQVTRSKNIPLFSHAASSLSLRQGSEKMLFWRMAASNDLQVEKITELLTQNNRHRRIFLMSGRDIYSKEIAEGIRKKFPKSHIEEISYSERINVETFNLKTNVQDIQQFAPDSMVFTVRANIAKPLLEKLSLEWSGPLPLIVAGDILPKPTKEVAAGIFKASQCLKVLLTEGAESIDINQSLYDTFQIETSGFDAAYVYDSVMLLAMAKHIELSTDKNFHQALASVTNVGFEIHSSSYGQLLPLLKQHRQLKYHGASGKIYFNDEGDNAAANISISNYLPANQKPPLCLQNLVSMAYKN